MDFTVVGGVTTLPIQNKLKKFVQNVIKFILFHLAGPQKEHFAVKSVKTTQCAIMFQEFVENAEKHLNYQEEIWKEAEGTFVLLDAI